MNIYEGEFIYMFIGMPMEKTINIKTNVRYTRDIENIFCISYKYTLSSLMSDL